MFLWFQCSCWCYRCYTVIQAAKLHEFAVTHSLICSASTMLNKNDRTEIRGYSYDAQSKPTFALSFEPTYPPPTPRIKPSVFGLSPVLMFFLYTSYTVFSLPAFLFPLCILYPAPQLTLPTPLSVSPPLNLPSSLSLCFS